MVKKAILDFANASMPSFGHPVLVRFLQTWELATNFVTITKLGKFNRSKFAIVITLNHRTENI